MGLSQGQCLIFALLFLITRYYVDFELGMGNHKTVCGRLHVFFVVVLEVLVEVLFGDAVDFEGRGKRL